MTETCALTTGCVTVGLTVLAAAVEGSGVVEVSPSSTTGAIAVHAALDGSGVMLKFPITTMGVTFAVAAPEATGEITTLV